MHILIIHSEYETRQFLYQVLTDEGYDVTLWERDLQVSDMAHLREPILLIVEWQADMAKTDFSQWQALKETAKLPPVCCLMLMPEAAMSSCPAALQGGIDDWLTHPFEISELKARILANQRILKIKEDLQNQKLLLETELSEAEAYVRSLLPGNLTEKVPINARFIPSRLLGGDCYDYYWLDPDYLVMYLLDVSGHGLGSALLSTSVLNMLRSQSLPDVNFYRPEKVLKALNDTFQMNEQNEKYFTMWYGVYNRANRQLLYASAGHPPAVLISQSEQATPVVECLKTPGLPIGMLPDMQYQWQRCSVPPASRLYLFSDGVYEIKQIDNTIMGLNDFIDILSQQSFEGAIDNILAQVNTRNRDRTFADDLSLLEVCLD